MIESVLPPDVVGSEAFEDVLDEPLFPAEEAMIECAVEERRREFATVRVCARRALAGLHIPQSPIVSGVRGAPIWPPGVVGSMTHCVGYRAAAVASARFITAIGIDAEPHEPLPDDVLALISLPQERRHLARLGSIAPSVCWDRMLFSAKESVYKAWFPRTGQWLDFEQVEVAMDLTGRIRAQVFAAVPDMIASRLETTSGRWQIAHGIILTTIIQTRPIR